MSRLPRPSRGSLSLAISVLALVIALSGTAYAALADGSVRTRHLAKGAVTTPKLATSAVTSEKLARGAVATSDLRDDAVGGAKVRNGSLSLHDLGGMATQRTSVLSNARSISAGQCATLPLALYNPTPAGLLGSMVVGTVTTSDGKAVVDNSGAVLPTLVTETSQGGAFVHLVVCAGQSAQTVPAGAVVTWSLIKP